MSIVKKLRARPGVGRSTVAAFALESLISGFYIVITRSLAPVLFAVMGMTLIEIVRINVSAYIAALLTVLGVYNARSLIQNRVKLKLLVFHGLERVAWGFIPIAASISGTLLYMVYTLAVCLTVPTGILVNAVMLGGLSSEDAKKLFAIRSALGAVSSIVGQLLTILILALLPGVAKYLYLYLLAMAVGLCATIVLSFAAIPRIVAEEREEPRESVEAIKASTAFLFLAILLSSSSIIGTIWGPYLIRKLHAAEYIAVATGFIYTVTSIFASLFWNSKPYTVYRVAIASVATVPMLIAMIRIPTAHLAIAALYAFTNTGANFLASFVFADIAKRINVFKASTMLIGAWCLSQVMGLGSVYIAIPLGAVYAFIVSMVFVGLATAIAFTTIPEVAIVPEHLTISYARQLYHVSIASYSFMVFTIRSYIVLTLKLLGLSIVFLLLYTIYRIMLYITTLKP
ncbi:MAG TPA: hypothetical protein EYH02_04305 [Ignisphaera aggregans]|uniref:MFS transporter n=1 Tax=Ignisphaera aggregans TaxID=334771 RepID=A0A832Z012_9CREN|nr:hypothetical protein [Ignisphaera aggregans]